MCGICGCGSTTIAGGIVPRDSQSHGHDHHHHDHHHHHESGAVGSAAEDATRRLRVERDILEDNNRAAGANRVWFTERGVLALNLLSAPGSGKTTLLVRTITDLMTAGTAADRPITVIEGDQQTDLDAARIRATGVPAIQINTGKGCHLDAAMVTRAATSLALAQGSVLFIENVGNLVCPAAFDLGETHRVVVVSVTEGEDKPLKYPDMFHSADLMLINKVDLLPHVAFDVERCVALARTVNPSLVALPVSATTGEGLDAWYGWLRAHHPAPRLAHAKPI
ncbi:hydrogenase nickel incorporation protein HypB [Roseospira marina]|uniref:Hydrogenase maturation factor HypB n=1 Tax=Roseospira marina TaxID=140057 RepID=A0A5M6IDX7_9PROT|nr:hydrogenase nickel incorporation protein HypB [Roseospira marina]KAA5606272.1 hydrogenase nickel incorporation protein HypB [Roseospira marina]MBB4314430.1 hydrogenase nickel incorporation protein HypB [Roseospira marina]MBB5087590.1 hydrogenase nickel incorporation protein HypB [Roseospira marina]